MTEASSPTPRFPVFLHGGDYNPDQWLDHPEILEQTSVSTKRIYLEYRKWEDVSKARSGCRECWNICKGKIKRARTEKEKIQSSFFFCRFL